MDAKKIDAGTAAIQIALRIANGIENKPHALLHFATENTSSGGIFAWRWDKLSPREMECLHHLLNEANRRLHPENDAHEQIEFVTPAIKQAIGGNLMTMYEAAGMLEQTGSLSRRAWLIKMLQAGLVAYRASTAETVEEINALVVECQEEAFKGVTGEQA